MTLLHNSTETVELPAGVTLEKNGFTAYLAADADYVYVLYVVKDENIINNGPEYASYWHNDCADFIINYDATANGGKEFRIFGNILNWKKPERTVAYTPKPPHRSSRGRPHITLFVNHSNFANMFKPPC